MADPASTVSENFVRYLREQGLYERLPEIIDLLRKEADRQAEVTVVSAEPLSGDEQRQITEKAVQTWGDHPVTFHVDSLLVSGLLIRFRDQLLDLSGRGRLADLKATLS